MNFYSREELVQLALKIAKTTGVLAEELGISERTVFRWVSGDSKPSGDSIAKLYDFLIKHADH